MKKQILIEINKKVLRWYIETPVMYLSNIIYLCTFVGYSGLFSEKEYVTWYKHFLKYKPKDKVEGQSWWGNFDWTVKKSREKRIEILEQIIKDLENK